MKQTVHNFEQGETVVAFDSKAWNKVGHDIGDNSQFWKEAKIMQFRLGKSYDDGKKVYLADLHFIYNNTISRGHFVHGLKKK